MASTVEPRIRDLYKQYLDGRLPFDELMAIADRRLAEFDSQYQVPEQASKPGSR
jgi:hypothetical protein